MNTKTNVIQALEILLVEKSDQYISTAIDIVDEWFGNGDHDAYYYYDVLALLPDSYSVKRKVLKNEYFQDYIRGRDSYNCSARKALIKAKDLDFCNSLGKFLDNYLKSSNLIDEDIEENIIDPLIDLGHLHKHFISSDSISVIQDLFYRYLDKDKKIIDRFFNDEHIQEDERQIWIGDNIAYWCWMLGWHQFLDDIKESEWYWASMFGDWWDDSDNNNLLVWSLFHNNKILKNQSIHVMESHEYQQTDGAIAWVRLHS